MLARLILLSVLSPALVVVPWSLSPAIAWAEDEEEEAEEGGGDEGGGEDEEEEGALDPDQPAVTAGGLYTVATYPASEIERTLTMTKGVVEARAGLGFDLTKGQTFETWVLGVRARYGMSDLLELQVGSSFNMVQPEGASGGHSLALGIETAIAYDLVDFRLTAEMPVDPFAFNIVFGFPVKYRVKPNLAVIALDRFFTIHTDGAKPDLTVGVGAVFQPVPVLAVIARAQLLLPQFDPDVVAVPATAAVQFSPSGRVDLGAEFTFGNIKAENRFDNRSLALYFRARM